MENQEEFSEQQRSLLGHYVTNTEGNVFVLRNLPEVIKGALFSRYSRSSLGLRSLLLKEFIQGEETAFEGIVAATTQSADEQVLAIQRAQNFYDRILDGYGDDSIGELGGAHLAVENVSMVATKMIEDCRLGGSPLEKSTRYIYFDQKVNGQYLYYREPILMTSAYKESYLTTCDTLFETYSALIPPLTEQMEEHFPKEEGGSKAAYAAAIRAKVLDCLRGLLPASTLTNMGIMGNGRFFEALLHKMHNHNLAELQEIGRGAYDELAKVIPSFIRRSEVSHRHHKAYAQFSDELNASLKKVSSSFRVPASSSKPGVKLVHMDPNGAPRIAASLLYAQGDHSLTDLQAFCHKLPREELARIFDAASVMRENRRQKSPRAIEHETVTFEVVADYGIYRDLQRHRICTQERQLLTCNHGYFIPEELLGTDMEKPYREALEMAKENHDQIASELTEEAQYIVPMAYNIRWYFHINLRSLQWMTELRSQPAGHPNYRKVAQEMALLVCEAEPLYKTFFKFVDFDGHDLGRLGQEERKVRKKRAQEQTTL